jgi:hypothetical protein
VYHAEAIKQRAPKGGSKQPPGNGGGSSSTNTNNDVPRYRVQLLYNDATEQKVELFGSLLAEFAPALIRLGDRSSARGITISNPTASPSTASTSTSTSTSTNTGGKGASTLGKKPKSRHKLTEKEIATGKQQTLGKFFVAPPTATRTGVPPPPDAVTPRKSSTTVGGSAANNPGHPAPKPKATTAASAALASKTINQFFRSTTTGAPSKKG